MTLKRVVITGLGALTPIGNSVATYWKNLVDGISGADKITHFDAEKFKTRFACEIKNFDGESYFGRKEAKRMDLFSQYAVFVADQAIEDAALDFTRTDTNRAGVIWGSGIGGLNTFEQEVMGYAKGNGTPRFNPFFIPKMIIDLSAGHISMKYGLCGPNYATVSACASATNAIIDAFNYIRLGMADLFVTGGSEAAVTQAGIGGFSALKALSQRNESPKTASRPFDQDRDGFVLGEGAAALILEDLDHALQRKAKIYAEVLGAGMSADAYHMTAPHPQGKGIRLVMTNALKDAKIKTTAVDYINVHGTSTPLGDLAELSAIEKVFGEHAYALNISATKSMTGHLLGAAGAIETVASILSLQKQIVPPTINSFTPDAELNPRLNLTFNKAQSRDIKVAMNNTFGFGGHNCSLVLGKYKP